MWIITTILVLFMNGANGENNCILSPFQICISPGTEHIKTAEDFNEFCPIFANYIECLGNYDETCKGRVEFKVFPREREFQNVLEIISDVCDKGSLLHEAVSTNTKCMLDSLGDHRSTCRKMKNRFVQEYIKQNNETEHESFHNETNCLRYFYDSSCFANHVSENCGLLAKQAVLEIIRRTQFHRNSCSLRNVIALSHNVEDMNADETEKKNLSEAFFRLMNI